MAGNCAHNTDIGVCPYRPLSHWRGRDSQAGDLEAGIESCTASSPMAGFV
jgi:hypothetical protein